MSSKTKRFLIYWLPVLIWAGMIFYSSSMTYEEQSLQSELSRYLDAGVIESTFNWVKFDYAGSEVSIEQLGAVQFIEFFIRKGAHFTVYFVLAFLLYRAFWSGGLQQRKTFFLSWFLAALYAATDELHQGFTAHRTPLAVDVMLDTVSACVGVAFALLFYKKKRGPKYSQK
jgi:VanZ family protein